MDNIFVFVVLTWGYETNRHKYTNDSTNQACNREKKKNTEKSEETTQKVYSLWVEKPNKSSKKQQKKTPKLKKGKKSEKHKKT